LGLEEVGLSGRALALQAGNPDFKPQSHSKEKKTDRTENNELKIANILWFW
jgi:hypothetical protein